MEEKQLGGEMGLWCGVEKMGLWCGMWDFGPKKSAFGLIGSGWNSWKREEKRKGEREKC